MQRIKRRIIQGVILIVGVHLDAGKAFLRKNMQVFQQVRVSRMERGKGNDPFRTDGLGPGKDWGILCGAGGNGADDGFVDAAAIHGIQQRCDRSVEKGLDVAFPLQRRNGCRGDAIGEGVGMEVDDAGHGVGAVSEVCGDESC